MLYWKRPSSNLRTTPVYRTFWQFATERQDIFVRRLRGDPGPWTDDWILQKYRFTNAYRVADRVSQYVIGNVIHNAGPSPDETLFRILLFKFFNRIETWTLLVQKGLQMQWEYFDWKRASKILEEELRECRPVYSGAYIMPPAQTVKELRFKHDSHFEVIRKMMRSGLASKLQNATSMERAYSILREYPLMGPFLAYQLVTDINYSEITAFDEMEFTVAGPGARSGIAKCFSQRSGWTDEDIIRYVTARQEEEFAKRGLKFRTLWGRRLQLIDVQNLFCEVDKYARAKHVAFNKSNGRHRIKRRFTPSGQIVRIWLPPKWKLNRRIEEKPYL